MFLLSLFQSYLDDFIFWLDFAKVQTYFFCKFSCVYFGMLLEFISLDTKGKS